MERFEEWYGAGLAAVRAAKSTGCVEIAGSTHFSHGPIPETLEETVRLARAVFSGKIIGIDGGFFGGKRAGLLLQIKVSKWIMRRPDYPRAPVVYLYYPSGDFKYGDLRICKRDTDWPDPPRVGDEVLLFPILVPADSDGITVKVTGVGVGVAIDRQDGPYVTRAVADLIPEFRSVAFDDLKRAVREGVRRQRGASR